MYAKHLLVLVILGLLNVSCPAYRKDAGHPGRPKFALLFRSGSRKNIGGRGLAPHHLGGNNEQNYCVQLSSIKQLTYNLCTV